MNEYDRNFPGGRQRRAVALVPVVKITVTFARQKLAGRRLQRGAVAFDVARFKKKFFRPDNRAV